MIYAASLMSPIRKAYGDKCYATQVQKIVDQMSLDPKVSQMDACVLGPKDVTGINKTKVLAALKTKHPDVCVIYIYSKDKEGELLDVKFKKCIKKITADSMRDAIDEYLGAQNISEREHTGGRDAMVEQPATPSKRRAPVMSEAMKGGLFKDHTRDEEETTVSSYDEEAELNYKSDILGRRIYYDDDGNELSPAQVEAQKEKVSARMQKEAREAAEKARIEAEETERLREAEEAVTKAQNKSTSASPTKEIEVEVYVDSDGEEVGPNFPGATKVVKKKLVPNENYIPQSTPRETVERAKSRMELNIENIKDFHDWDYYTQCLKRDAVMRELLEENATFQGVVQMLNVLDTEIKGVFYDRGLTTEQKFEKIMDIGNKRSQLMATHNDIVSKKVMEIVETITSSARRVTEELVVEHRDALEMLNKQDRNLMDESHISKAIDSRSAIVIELMSLHRSVLSLLHTVGADVQDFIVNMNKNLPSDNEFINSMVGKAGIVNIPTNTQEIANKLMGVIRETVAEKPGTLAALDKYVTDFIDAIVRMLKSDEDIIEEQQQMIRLLKAHKVEDIVVVDGVLKSVLNVFVGADGSGRTATTLVWAGCQTRRRNTLVIDLSNNSKVEDYGVNTVDLDTFMRSRIDKPLCVVRGKVADIEELGDLVVELKTRLDYYAYIDIVLDDTQVDYVKFLADESLTVNYITDCTNESIAKIAAVYSQVVTNNVAYKLIMIDPPVSVLDIANRAGVDPTSTKCISIPYVQKVKTCSVVHDVPYEYPEVRAVYEEAFR